MRWSGVVALVGLSGCSFLGVQSKPTAPWIGDGPSECNGYGLPVADAVVAAAVLGWVGAYSFAVTTTEQGGHRAGWGLILGIPDLAIGLVEAAAAIHGFREVHRCRRADEPVALRHQAGGVFYCTRSSTGAIGSCSDTNDTCERVRAVQVAANHEMTACAEQADVICFGFRSTDGEGHVACAPTVPACNALRGGLEYRSGISTLQECGEMPLVHRERPAASPADAAPPAAVVPAAVRQPTVGTPPPPPETP